MLVIPSTTADWKPLCLPSKFMLMWFSTISHYKLVLGIQCAHLWHENNSNSYHVYNIYLKDNEAFSLISCALSFCDHTGMTTIHWFEYLLEYWLLRDFNFIYYIFALTWPWTWTHCDKCCKTQGIFTQRLHFPKQDDWQWQTNRGIQVHNETEFVSMLL